MTTSYDGMFYTSCQRHCASEYQLLGIERVQAATDLCLSSMFATAYALIGPNLEVT